MSATLTKVEVPDIGDFDEVPIIEILVSVGDSVAVEDPLVTLESDKATMDVPAPTAGVVREISVSIGDQVSQGSVLMSLEGGDGDPGGGEPAEQAAAADRAAEATTAPAESVEAPSQPAARRRRRGLRLGAGHARAGARADRGGSGAHERRRADLRQPVRAAARPRAGRGPARRRRQRPQGADHPR